MFGIGFGEILIVLLIAIVFIRPEDLPKFLARAGRLYGQLKRMYNEVIEVKDKIIKEIDDTGSLDEAPSSPGSSDGLRQNRSSPPKTKDDT